MIGYNCVATEDGEININRLFRGVYASTLSWRKCHLYGGTPVVAGAAIADISLTAGDMSAEERGKFNAVLAALRGIGIILT